MTNTEFYKKWMDAVIEIETGFSGVLIKRECDYALYICPEMEDECLNIWHTRFYTDGRFMRLRTTSGWNRHCVDWSITVNEEYIISKGQYSLWLDNEQVSSIEQGNKIIIDGENNDYGGANGFGGFNRHGELILFLVTGKEEKNGIYPSRYIGTVTNKEIIYGENFKDFDESGYK